MSEQHPQAPDRFLTEAEAADLIGFSKNTLRAWRVTGRPNNSAPPPFVKHGRSVRYRLSDLLRWMDGCPRHGSTSDPGSRGGYVVANGSPGQQARQSA